jgi:peptidoglycan hydrolase CwlO-like protein
MVLFKSVFVLLLVTFSYLVVVSSEFVSEKIAEFVTKDEMNKVLELVKLQDHRISELKTEMTKKNMEINRFDRRVAELQVRVLEQSKKIAELEGHDKMKLSN